MTHKELVKIAKKYLKKIEKCRVVIAEKGAEGSPEVPDSIGFRTSRASILIECKTSRSDFRADSKKWFRQDGLGMGQTRYFMAPEGVIPVEELPQGWGLLEITANSKILVTKKCDLLYFDEKKTWAEMPLLLGFIRKLQWSNYLLRKELRKKKKK